jgi:hypothetical protein
MRTLNAVEFGRVLRRSEEAVLEMWKRGTLLEPLSYEDGVPLWSSDDINAWISGGCVGAGVNVFGPLLGKKAEGEVKEGV